MHFSLSRLRCGEGEPPPRTPPAQALTYVRTQST